jgi:hypothetical protein
VTYEYCEGLEELIKEMPGETLMNSRNSESMERTILELKRLKKKNLVFEQEDAWEYYADINALISHTGRI